jgi:hypothetical protein
MPTLKDQLAKLGIEVEGDPFTPAWGGAHQEAKPRPRAERGAQERPSRAPQARGERRAEGGRDQGGRPQQRGRDQGARDQVRGRRTPAPSVEVPSDPQEREAAIQALFKRARLPLPPPGPRRFYVQEGELIEFIEMDAQSFEPFRAGELGLAYDHRGRLCVLNRQALIDLKALRGEL